MLTSGRVAETSVNLRDGPDGNVVDVILFGVGVQVLNDFGDGWPLVLAGSGASAEVGFIDAHFVAWDTPQVETPVPTTTPTGTNSGTQKYTDSPFELPVVKTTVRPAQLVPSLHGEWPDLTENGARTMVAQYWHETGGGQYCFDWNFGNQKCPGTNQYHMYLKNVWECYSNAQAQSQIRASDGLARIPTADEIRMHGWRCSDTVVVFGPPSPQSRFLAFGSIEDAVHSWCDRMRAVAADNRNFLTQLNSGDTGATAQSLFAAHYYTGSEASYAQGLASARAKIDQILGPIQ
jgi:hypothetical protein